MHDETIREDVRMLKNAVFGNPENPRENPGVVSELARMNETLSDMKDAMRKINITIILGFLTALMAMVFKSISA